MGQSECGLIPFYNANCFMFCFCFLKIEFDALMLKPNLTAS